MLRVVELSILFLIVFAIGEVAYRLFKVNAEYTRKWSHIASGILSLSFPYFLQTWQMVGLICLLFTIILTLSSRYRFLPSINSVDRQTFGSFLFPLAVFVSFFSSNYFNHSAFFYLSVLILAICDLLAAIIGKRWPIMKIKLNKETKSLGGFFAFVGSALIILLVFINLKLLVFTPILMFLPLFWAFVELISPKGTDNISIPISVILGLFLTGIGSTPL